MKKRLLSILLVLCMVCTLFPVMSFEADAATLTLQQLQSKFPQDMYWNHQAKSGHKYSGYTHSGSCGDVQNTCTSTPCANHNNLAAIKEGQYTCNCYNNNSIQCQGFAKKLAYDAYGVTNINKWTQVKDKATAISCVKPGDVINYKDKYATSSFGHWVFVINVSGSVITVGECNGPKTDSVNDGQYHGCTYGQAQYCRINWTRKIDINRFNSITLFRAPSVLPGGSTPPTPPAPTVNFSFDGLSTTDITETNATVKFTHTVTNASSYRVGVEVEGVGSYTYPTYFTKASLSSTYDLAKECGFTLTSGTAYRWRAYLLVGNDYCYSDYVPFTTRATSTPVTVNINQYKSTSSTQTNAALTAEISKSAGTCTALKFEIYQAGTSNLLGEFVAGASLGSGTTKFDFTVDVQQDVGISLTPGTSYECYFYAYIDGKWYKSGCAGISTRPDSVNFGISKEYLSTEFNNGVRTYDDTFVFVLHTNQDGCVFNRAGVLLYNSNGEQIKDFGYNFGNYTNYSGNYQMEFNTTDYGVSFANGTLYYVRPYMTVEGKTGYGAYSAIFVPKSPTPNGNVGYSYESTDKVLLDANGGICSVDSMLILRNDSIGYLPTPTRKGYDFVGWSTTKTGQKIITEQNKAKDIGAFVEATDYTETLYAIWKAHEYSITYQLNGGSGNVNNPKTYNIATPLTELREATWEGHEFLGWFADPWCSTSVSAIGGGAVGDVTVYAQWAEIHTHSYTARVVKPTCTDEGYTLNTCSCGDSYRENYTAALGHAWDSGKVTKAATETSTGIKTFTCTRCGTTKTEIIPVLTHTHRYTAVVTNPTCTEQGYTTHTCSCGDSYKDNYTAALGHAWDSGRITKQPTETSTGIKTFNCTRCTATKTETIPPLSHTHNYTAVVTKPTCTEKGCTTYTCSCGDSYKTDYVASLGHNYINGVCNRCGADDPNYNPTPVNPFTDIGGLSKSFQTAILWAYNNNIAAGATATTYNPNGACTRGQVVTFLWRAAGKPEPTTTVNPYNDVKSGPFYKAILWAAENGITAGYNNPDGSKSFKPNDTVTRGQFVTFLWRYEGKPTPRSTVNPFNDVKSGGFYNAILWGSENGIVAGYNNTDKTMSFKPNNPCTRAHVAVFLYRDLA